MNVKYLGPIRDYSGYGETSRHHVAALNAAGVEVDVKPVMYTLDNSDFGEIGKLVNGLVNRKLDCKIKLLHTTPDQFPKYIERGKYHVGFMYWETDKVPREFADGLKMCDEIWTASEANEQAIRNAGVDRPVYKFPQPLEVDREEAKPFSITDFNGYLFYSIFEWTERKNPRALLEAYYREFQNGENIGLMIKTYHKNFTDANKRMITKFVLDLKREMALPKYPPVFLYKELMNRNQISRFHATGDCFVSAHRGEGWGLPQVEALLAAKPMISTAYGGVHEYLDTRKTAFLVPFTMVPVKGMEDFARWYTPDQKWASPKISESDAGELSGNSLRYYMRLCYEQQEAGRKVGAAGRNLVLDKFNLLTVGNLMADRLREIEAKL